MVEFPNICYAESLLITRPKRIEFHQAIPGYMLVALRM